MKVLVFHRAVLYRNLLDLFYSNIIQKMQTWGKKILSVVKSN